MVKPIYILSIIFILLTSQVMADDDLSIDVNDTKSASRFSEKISDELIGHIYMNESEYYATYPRNRTYKTGMPSENYAPDPLKGKALNNYFKSLNLTDDYIYVMIQFEHISGKPTKEEIAILEEDNIVIFEKHSDTYYAKVPRAVLETKLYDFVRWIGIIEKPESKISSSLKELIIDEKVHRINITIIPYEKFNVDQYNQIKRKSLRLLDSEYTVNRRHIKAEIEVSKLQEISSLNFVKKIEGMGYGSLSLDRSAEVISADYVWPSFDASGITVGVIDSGIEHNHDHFDSVTVYNAHDYEDGDEYPEAECGEADCSDGVNNDGDNGRI